VRLQMDVAADPTRKLMESCSTRFAVPGRMLFCVWVVGCRQVERRAASSTHQSGHPEANSHIMASGRRATPRTIGLVMLFQRVKQWQDEQGLIRRYSTIALRSSSAASSQNALGSNIRSCSCTELVTPASKPASARRLRLEVD